MKHEITRDEVLRMLEGRKSWQELYNKITFEKHTEKLLKILPTETVTSILRAYRTMLLVEEVVLRSSHLRRTDILPTRHFNQIRKILLEDCTERKTVNNRMIVTPKWLEKDAVEDIMQYIEDTYMHSHKGFKLLSARAKDEYIKLLKLTKKIPPVNFAIHFLAEHLRAKKVRFRWKMIHGFLKEQGIIDKKDEDIDLFRARFEKLRRTELEKHYDFYRECHLYPALKTKRRGMPFDQQQQFLQQAYYQRDILLPPWHELLPNTE